MSASSCSLSGIRSIPVLSTRSERAPTTVAVPAQLLPTNITSRSALRCDCSAGAASTGGEATRLVAATTTASAVRMEVQRRRTPPGHGGAGHLGHRVLDRGMIDHFGINVTDMEKAGAFYDKVLGVLGHRRVMDFGTAVGYGTDSPDFWISTFEGVGPNREMHLAFQAPDAEHVRAFVAAA